MGWWIALAVLILLAVLPLGIRLIYRSEGLKIQATVSFLHFRIWPRKKKQKKEKPEKQKKTPAQKQSEPVPEEKKGGSLKDFLPLVKLGLKMLNTVRQKLRVDRLTVHITMAEEDPCDLAVHYGMANSALGALWPALEQWLVIKKRDVQIGCDFNAEETLVTADVQITITLGRLLVIAAVYGVKLLQEFLKLKNLRKGGSIHESDIT